MSASDQPGSADDGETVTLNDMLNEFREESLMQEDATAVLGDSDDQNCTYNSGYVKRQALYACSTCAPNDPAGICLACSYTCHDGHSLYELYTKRFFRCDCGNSKFGDNKCKLDPVKDDVNAANHYNQNFKGTYCTCARPYPDPEDETEDEMIQCVLCEDWYHGRHLNVVPPENENFHEMICTDCMDKHSFLWAYQVGSHAVAVQKESTDGDASLDVGGGEGESPLKTENQTPVKEESVVKTETTTAGATCSSDTTSEAPAGGSEPPLKRLKTDAGNGTDSDGKNQEPCQLRDLQKREMGVQHCASFWSEGWRDKLCKCSVCKELYTKESLEFLLDPEDSMTAYEERGRKKNRTPSDSELTESALAGMNHVQKIEVIQGFNEMKTELATYLQSFAENGKVVKKEDINAFFEELRKKKRNQLSNLQYSCK